MRVSFLKAPIGGIIGLEMITFVEPLGLECVAGGLEEEGHTCQIIDMRIDGLEKGLEQLRAFKPDIIGLQCNFTTERFRSLRLARRVREEGPRAAVRSSAISARSGSSMSRRSARNRRRAW